MIKTMTRMLAATAALGLVAAPIAAEANTRAQSSTTYSIGNAGPGLGRADSGEDIVAASGGFLLLIIGGAVFVLGVLTATDVIGDDGDADGDGSPGT